MELVRKFKETFISVMPIALTSLVIGLTIAPLGGLLPRLIIGSALVISGLSIFLAGTDIGLVPIGEKLGERVSRKRSLPLLLVLGAAVGFCVTFAEPDVNVLCSQVAAMGFGIDSGTLKLLIASGLAALLSLGLFCIFRKIRMKIAFLILYAIVLVIIPFVGETASCISFDASGSTTGPLAIPFIIALGLGISKTSKKGDVSGFGLTGIASVGPVMAVLIGALLLMRGAGSQGAAAVSASHASESLVSLPAAFSDQFFGTVKGFSPLVALIAMLQLFLVRFPRIKLKNVSLGILYSFVGIVVFLAGAEYGFMPVGRSIGYQLFNFQPWYVTSFVAFLIGLFTVASEPAVWVLTDQVEEVTSGRIRRRTVLIFLCFGVSMSVFLAAIRVYFAISYLYFVYAGIGLSLVLSAFCPPLFTSLAFDSGGVASGPMSASFILSFISGGTKTGDSGFGVIGLIAIAPIISIQILGIMYRIREGRTLRQTACAGG